MRRKQIWKSIIGTALALTMVFSMTEVPLSAPQTKLTKAQTQDVHLRLQYDEPAADRESDPKDEEKNWENNWESKALPIGNGKLAAMVYGGVDAENIQFNEETVWSGGPGAQRSYKGGSNSSSKTKVQDALRNTRNLLQQLVYDFTRDNSAYKDENGQIIASDYEDFDFDNDSKTYFRKNLDLLKGDRSNYGYFQSVGNIRIEEPSGPKRNYTNYVRSSDIDTAVQQVTYKVGDVTYTRELFASNPANIIAVRLNADKTGKITKDIFLSTEQKKGTLTVDEKNGIIDLEGKPADHTQKNHLNFACRLKVIPKNGTMKKTDDNKLRITNADSVVLLMTVSTNYQTDPSANYDFFSDDDPMVTTEKNIDNAAKKGYDALLKEHIADYQNLYNRATVNFNVTSTPTKMTDDLLKGYGKSNTAEEDRYMDMLFFQYGRYLLIASSRENSILPANLQGKWANGLSPMWNSDYHTNINLQMNYWPAEQTNLAECHKPVIDFVNNLVEKGKVTVEKYYSKENGDPVRGWTIHHENNIWGHTAPGDWNTAFYFPAAGAWMCQDIWETYLYNEDKTFLSKNFDTMLQAALFWVDNLWVDKRDGTLVANPSYSPEHGAYSLGCISDQAIIWELFQQVKLASEVLGKSDDSEVKEVLAAQSKLYMPRNNTLGGQYREWKDETDLEITNKDWHRHQNHLFVLHPGTYLIKDRSTWDNHELEAAIKTLNVRGDGATGWSKAWKLNMWARLRDGNRAKKLLSEQITGSTMDNLFDTHPPFQIDGNFGATSGVCEMLLQSQGDYIEPLAALPSAWSKGNFQGLKARGNFVIDCTWDNEKATSLSITSQSGKECKVKYRQIDKAKIINKATGKEVENVTREQGIVTFATEKGATYVFSDMSSEEGGTAVIPDTQTWPDVPVAESPLPFSTPTPIPTPTPEPTPTPVPTATPTVAPSAAPTASSAATTSPTPDQTKNTLTLAKAKIKKVKKNGKKKVTVSFAKVKNAAGYEIRYATKSTMKNAKTVTVSKGSATSKTISLAKKKTYYIQVRAFAKQGKKKITGSWSAKKKIKL